MKTAAGTMTNEMYLIQTGAKTLGASTNAIQIALKSGIAGTGAAATWGGNAGDIPAIGATGSGAGAVTLATAFAGFDEWTRKQGRKSGAVDIGWWHSYLCRW